MISNEAWVCSCCCTIWNLEKKKQLSSNMQTAATAAEIVTNNHLTRKTTGLYAPIFFLQSLYTSMSGDIPASPIPKSVVR